MSRREHAVIYVTGLNDRNVAFQKRAVSWWRIYGVEPILFQTNWTDKKSFSEKLDSLLALIDHHEISGQKVSLVGVSAGASMAVAAYSRRGEAIHGVAFICGKLRRPEAVGVNYYLKNPAFREAMNTLNQNIASLTKQERARILSTHPLFDETVVITDTFVDGAKKVILPTLFHVPSIVLGITIFSWVPLLFLKHLAKE